MSKKIEMTAYEMELAYHGLRQLLPLVNEGNSHYLKEDEIKALMEKIREAHNNE